MELTREQKILIAAEVGYKQAQYRVVFGYAFGCYGFEQKPDKLPELAELDWPFARTFVFEGYKDGLYGFPKDEAKANELKKKWNI